MSHVDWSLEKTGMRESVWIVTEGEYSDYRIVAVFATAEEAKAFINGAAADGHPYVECREWPIGAPSAGFYQPTWSVALDLESGDLVTNRDNIVHPPFVYELHPPDWSAGDRYQRTKTKFVSGRSTVSKEHALKVAAETRQAWLREPVR